MTEKATPPGSTVFRLTDMVTEEVSLVDHAANRRKFLVVKRDAARKNEGKMPAGAEVVQGPSGSLTAATTTTAASAAVPPATTAAAPLAPASTAKAGGALTKDAKDTLLASLDEAESALADARKMVEGATEVETEAEMDVGPACEAIMAVSETCEDACYALVGMGEDGTLEGEEPPAVGQGEVADPAQKNIAPPSLPMSKRLGLRKAHRFIAKANAVQLGQTIAKRGAKMSKERFVRLQQGINLLSSVLSEVAPAIEAYTEKGKPPKAKPGVPQAAPGMGGKAQAAKVADPTSVAMAKRDETFEQVQALAKRQAEELTTLRAKVTASNATPVERVRGREKDISWPMDLNKDIEPEGSERRFG